MTTPWRAVLYLWALPTTSVGVLVGVASVLSGGRGKIVRGVWEVHGGLARLLLKKCPLPGGASAMTLGHVVIAQDENCLEWSREHERVHVRQVERWGPLFFPAYLLASLIAAVHGKDFYRDNRFEREAYAWKGHA